MNQLDFKGRHAVVTGGATGLGYAIAQRLQQMSREVQQGSLYPALHRLESRGRRPS